MASIDKNPIPYSISYAFLVSLLKRNTITHMSKKKFDRMLEKLCELFRNNGIEVTFTHHSELKRQLQALSPEERRAIFETF